MLRLYVSIFTRHTLLSAIAGGKYFEKETGDKVLVGYEKMSKSKHNGVDPEVRTLSYSEI